LCPEYTPMYNACKRVINYLLFAVALSCFLFIPGNVNAQVNQVVDAGNPTAPAVFPSADCIYKWTNDNPLIGLAAKGTGTIASFIAKNDGYQPIVATINARLQTFGYQTVGTTTYAIDLVDYTQAGVVPVANANIQGTSPDGSAVYFASGSDNHTLYKVDGRNNKLLATIPVSPGYFYVYGFQPSSAALNSLLFSPNGQKIYSYSAQSKAIVVINTVTNAVEQTISLNPGLNYNALIQMSPDGSLLYIIGDPGSDKSELNIVSTVSNSIVDKVNITTRSAQLYLTPDGNKLYINSGYNNGTNLANPSPTWPSIMYDTATGAVTSTPIADGYRFVGISSDGSKTYYSQYKSVNYSFYPVFVADSKTGVLKPVDLGFSYSTAIQAIPNSNFVYFIESVTGNIKVISTITDDIVASINQAPEISYNVTSQAFQLNYDGTLLYVMRNAGVNVTENRGYLEIIDTKTNKLIESTLMPAKPSPILLTKGANPCSGSPVTFTITVNPPPPVITATGTLSKVDAVYGTAGASTNFTVSGTNLPAGILVTPPASYEVSIDGITYSNTITVGLSGKVVPTKVYLRLMLTSRVRSYSGNVILSSGTATAAVPTVSSAVTPAPLVITAPITKKYGEVLNDAGRSTVFTAVGLKNNETIGGITIHYSAGASANAAVGTYTGAVATSAAANGAFSSGNYTISYPLSDVIVEAAPLTITADDKERNYGEANPVLTFKYSGFVNGESAAQLTSLPVISAAAVLTSPVGQYPITISGAAALNYTFNYVPATLTIKSTPVTITTAFTPNGDGINDTWDLKAIGQYPGCTVEVMNRYGYKVFYSTGYPTAWDGRSNGANLPVGTYYYIIKLTSNIKPLTGYLAIIR
jgi:gliding motility-associated-like protein